MVHKISVLRTQCLTCGYSVSKLEGLQFVQAQQPFINFCMSVSVCD